MIETDKIVFAELASMLVAGHELDAQQEMELTVLLEKYPHGHVYLWSIIENGAIESYMDIHNIDTVLI